jgi:hypothetical protein
MTFDFRHLALLRDFDRDCVEYALVFNASSDVAVACIRCDVRARGRQCGEDTWSDEFTSALKEGGEALLALMLDLDMGD